MPETPENNQEDLDRRKYMADRMARLRDAARQDRKYFGELVVADATAAGGKRKPLLMVAAIGVVAVSGILMAVSMLGGGAASEATPAQDAAPGQPGDAPQGGGFPGATPTRTATRGASPTPPPTGQVTSTDPTEGAISRNAIQQVETIDVFLRMPVRGPMRVVEGFGGSRGSGDLVHAGIDLASAATTPFEVVAACDGTVAAVQKLTGYGDFIVIECGRNWRTVYGQLASTAVQTGTRVTAGETVIGTSGRFLHFEIRFNGAPVDPTKALTEAASATPTPTETPTPTATPTETATPAKTAESAATATATPPAATATPAPPTATPAPPTVTPTPEPTATPTRAAPRTPTPKPGIR